MEDFYILPKNVLKCAKACSSHKVKILGRLVPRGRLSTYAYGGGYGQPKEFSGNPKISVQLDCDPKISAHLYIETRS